MSRQTQGVSLFKPVILAGLNAILPVFGPSYADEEGHPDVVQMRGAFSTERRRVPNVVVSFRPGRGQFQVGQGLLDFDDATGLYTYGLYLTDCRLRYTVQGRNEAEREWLIDTLGTAFTGLVFVSPSTGATATNNVVNYLLSQGVVVTAIEAIDYPEIVASDDASPRPEGQVYEATLPVACDVSLAYEMPGVSAPAATFSGGYSLAATPAQPLPWEPNPGTDAPFTLT